MNKSIGAAIFGITGTAILLSLGLWQMQRLAWKEGILADIDARITAVPVAVPAAPDPMQDRFLPVTAMGRLQGPEIHVLVSTKSRGAGYRVIRAIETDTARLLVDLGYMPLTAKEVARPDLQTTVTGNLHWPDEIDSYTPENDLSKNIWFSRDVETLARALGTQPILIIARATTPAAPGLTPLPVDSSTIPNDHLQYAVTWFLLAVIWVGMTGYFVYRQRRDPS